MTHIDWNQDVRHIKLRIAEQQSPVGYYAAGDIAEVYYCNPTELVLKAFSIIVPDVDSSSTVSIECLPSEIRKSRMASISCTLWELFLRHLDIGGVPTRSFFEELSVFATSEEEREKLQELSSGAGTDLFFDYCVREKRSYCEVLEDFKSARPPLERLLEMIPVIRPRQYSIASPPSRDIELCVAVAKKRTPYGRVKVGLCSGYLAGLQAGETVVLVLRKGLLSRSRLCEAFKGPAILVGPGTGVAPLRAILMQMGLRHQDEGNRSSDRDPPTDVLLFFGCRKRNADYLFGQEWEDLNTRQRSSFRVVIHSAFSQDQAVKEYVTHKISSHAQEVWRLLQHPHCSVLVAGSARKMPEDVRQALLEVLQRCGGMDSPSAETFISNMVKTRRYIVEAWS
mmetsp:Transcript_34266/g.47066  ORF Transcript_34266/g.47066 Transcript_34266/m.47066 type:complete len:396 (-) Transcript_34266:77-1264(-)